MFHRLVQHKHNFALLASLALASGLCLTMIGVRVVCSGTRTYTFLVWNLFLAWIPLACALAASSLRSHATRLSYTLATVCALLWLIFLPNSPYVMTDLLHLQPMGNIPHWFDLIMILSFAWTGYLLGIASLYLMQGLVLKSFGKWASRLFVVTVLSLSSVGIYLGRFLRWNSWDIFLQPHSLLVSVWEGLSNPLAHPRTLVFSMLFTLFFISTYLTLFTLTRLPQEQRHF